VSSQRLFGIRKRLMVVPVLAVTAAAGTLALNPAVASARDGTKGFVVRSQPSHAATQPAINPSPAKNSKSEWFVASNGKTSTLLSINKAGKISKVNSTAGGGSTSAPSYGSVVFDGYEWLVRYGAKTSPLYAVSASGKVTKVVPNVGTDITDITPGTNNTLNFSSSDPSIGIQTCTVSTSASEPVSCLPQPFSLGNLLGNLLGFLTGKGELESLTSNNGLLWFTDSKGQVGSFNLLEALTGGIGTILSDLFGGPYGDTGSGNSAVGEGSATANTVTANKNGYLYIAGGQFQSKRHNNNTILKVNPNTGQTVKKYTRDLTDVTAITSGSGNDVWFLDRESSTAGRVGELNVKTGKITQYRMPKGFKLENKIAQIAPGPAGSNSVYFTLQTQAGKAAIGVATGS
jgi:hypothetical protein